jgi:hypothetical protein
MTIQNYPDLDPSAIADTRDALHAYSRVLGAWLKSCQSKRKHWWHASLRPSLSGLTTGVIHAGVDITLELNLSESLLIGRTSSGEQLTEELHGQSATDIASGIQGFMIAAGIDSSCIPSTDGLPTTEFAGFNQEDAFKLGRAVNAVSAALDLFRSSIREETSPIQLWPHHFDLSMLWLPGPKIPGQDPANEEYADKQMNFGFTFGDEAIPEPYFYVTAYPLPETFPELALPEGTIWRTEGFNGAVLSYAELLKNPNPKTYLVNLWTQLLSAGRAHMLEQST